MTLNAEIIEQRIRDGFPRAEIRVTQVGQSSKSYDVYVKDSSFKDISKVAQHRKIYSLLKDFMENQGGSLHAVSLTTSD